MRHRLWPIAFAVSLLASVIILLGSLEPSIQAKPKNSARTIPLVSVMRVEAKKNVGDIRVFATIRPRWQSAIKAPLSGELVQISEQVQPGKRVEKGDELFQIENSAYQVDVYEAQQIIAQAQLDLLLAEKQALLAQTDWQQSASTKAPPALALKKPQIELARKTIALGESRLRAAKHRLSKTRMKAPFSGLITKLDASPGQVLTEGEEILQLIDNTHLQTTAFLSADQGGKLPSNWPQNWVSIQNSMGVEIARALPYQQDLYIDPETQQYPIQLAFTDTSRSLSGEFVQLHFSGREVSNTLAIPESALTREGRVWYVDTSSHLRSFEAKVIYHAADQVIVQAPEKRAKRSADKTSPSAATSGWNIAITPMASFVAGELVSMQYAPQ